MVVRLPLTAVSGPGIREAHPEEIECQDGQSNSQTREN